MSTTLRFIFLLLALILCGQAHSRIITRQSPSSTSSSDLVSDGVHRLPEPTYLRLNPFSSGAESTCEQTYGFLPCTTTILGNLFLFIVYGYLMYLAATYLSGGSELLLEILGPGIVGGLFLPALGALPDAILILVSGLSGSKEAAQSQVAVGMGLLAGSTIMLLTVIWGTCVHVGKCDLEGAIAKDLQDTKGFSLTGSGVSTDIWTSYAARIMAVSILPFLIVQLPQLLNTTSGRHLVVLIGLIVSVSLFVSYCLYQVFQPWVQKRRLDYVKHKHVISGILQHLKQHANALGRLLDDEGEPDIEVIKKLFQTIDENNDGFLSPTELRALVIGFRLEEIDLDKNDAVEKLMKDFDTIENDSRIDEREFIAGITRWLNEAKRSGDISADPGHQKMDFLNNFHERTKHEHVLLGAGNQSDEAAEAAAEAKWTTIKAVLMLMLGTAIAAAFADPLVDVVDNFSAATSIPTFFISFIALPLATSSEAVSAIIFASRKKRRTASLTFSAQMASSQPSLDLNICPSGQATEVAPVWQPTFRTSLGPITVNDSVIRSPATALGVANNMLMPRDQLMLASRPDIVAADESQCWSIQASASVTNLCHRLRARVQENDSLKFQVAVLQKMLQEANKKIINLKQENTNLAKLVSNYEKEMRVKLQELEASRDQLSSVQKNMEEE